LYGLYQINSAIRWRDGSIPPDKYLFITPFFAEKPVTYIKFDCVYFIVIINLQAMTALPAQSQNTIERIIGAPSDRTDESRISLQLEQSDCDLEEIIPHPENELLLLVHEKGLRLSSSFRDSEYNSALPFDVVSSVEVLPKYAVEKKKRFSMPLFVVLTFLFALFIKLPAPYNFGDIIRMIVAAAILAVMFTAIAAFVFPAETIYRRLRIHFLSKKHRYQFTARCRQNNMEEVYGFFLHFMPEKFRSPLSL
jgi:hypothetical protein